MKQQFQEARGLFKNHGGILRMSAALRLGISRRTLYAMHERGLLERISRGVYRLTELRPLTAPDLVTVAARVPKGVICLISALSIHELTTQVPHQVDIAVLKGTRALRIDYPPTRFHWFTQKAFAAGINPRKIDGQEIRLYNAEKSIADAFKYRNVIGLDVALEALRAWNSQRNRDIESLMDYARVCRVENVLRPYVEALL